MTKYFFTALFIAVFDQLTKLLATDIMARAATASADELKEGFSMPIINGILNFTYVKNDGMSFGLLDDKRWIFMTLSTVGIALMAVYLVYLCVKKKEKDSLLCFSLAMVIGGGVGNMFDRIVLGYVVDFIDVCCFDFWMWTFNVADSCICIGAGLAMLAFVLEYIREKKK